MNRTIFTNLNGTVYFVYANFYSISETLFRDFSPNCDRAPTLARSFPCICIFDAVGALLVGIFVASVTITIDIIVSRFIDSLFVNFVLHILCRELIYKREGRDKHVKTSLKHFQSFTHTHTHIYVHTYYFYTYIYFSHRRLVCKCK